MRSYSFAGPKVSPTRDPVLAGTMDSSEDRLRFVLEEQSLCDTFLPRIASPRDQSVLVLGAGAGTDALWALRHGAREVVAIDLEEQDPRALRMAMAHFGLKMDREPELLQMSIEDAPSLGRHFDLILSLNVFEHVTNLESAFAACANLVRPDTGRIAIFSSPLYYSSMGSHMLLEPWEHLWGDTEAIMESLRTTSPEKRAALEQMSFADVLTHDIGLNRALVGDFLAAIARTPLACLNLETLPDRNLHRFAEFRPRLEGQGITPFDLTIEGIFLELALPQRRDNAESFQPAHTRPRAQETSDDLARRFLRVDRERAQLVEILHRTERSVSLRVGRMLTAPLRLARRSVGWPLNRSGHG